MIDREQWYVCVSVTQCVCDCMSAHVYMYGSLTEAKRKHSLSSHLLAVKLTKKMHVALSSKEATGVVVEGTKCVEKWEAPSPQNVCV